MKILFLGAAHEVTGSCTLIEVAGKKILVDCGMEQGADTYENTDLPVSAADIDCLLLTHAHIDHSGKIPLLVKNGFSGPIYATEATHRLCTIMLMDSAHIQQQEAMWRNRKAKRSGDDYYEPMYTSQDVQQTMTQFINCGYNTEYSLPGDFTVKFIDAGHLIGSASIELTVEENGITKTILFSGDVGNIDRPLIRDPQKPEKADYVVIESTYGNRVHGERKDYVSQLAQVIQETFDRGGNVVIPCFAVGRTQEMLYLIREIKEKRLVNNHGIFQVWVDSPLAVEATNIYSTNMTEYYDSDTLALVSKGINPISFDGLRLSLSMEESVAINADPNPKVILSASGMCEAGRIRHHLKHNLWRKDSTILFVGYQAEGSLGRIIINGAPSVKIFGEEIMVDARIEQMDGISGHADMNMLIGWLGNLKQAPQKVFVNHGGDTVCDEFVQTIESELSFNASAPYSGAIYDLVSGICVEPGNAVRIAKRSFKQKRNESVFERLVAAGKRLMSVIEKNRGGTNKNLAKFANQITDLCNKWDS